MSSPADGPAIGLLAAAGSVHGRGPVGLSARIAATIGTEIEAEQERWFLWIAVAFGTGIALYFAASDEPALWALSILALAAALCHGFARRSGLWGLASGAILAMALGGVVGKLRTEYMRAPVLTRQISAVQVKGWVELVEPRPVRGQRVVRRPHRRHSRFSLMRTRSR